MHFSALFGEVFRQTALSSLTFEREFFRCLPAGFFKHPLLRVTEKMQETRVTVFPPYPWQEYQTIWRFHSLGSSTVSSDILRLWMLARSRAWALDLRRSTTWTNQMAVFESLLTFSYTFNITELTHQIQLTLGVQLPATNLTILSWRNPGIECWWLISGKTHLS